MIFLILANGNSWVLKSVWNRKFKSFTMKVLSFNYDNKQEGYDAYYHIMKPPPHMSVKSIIWQWHVHVCITFYRVHWTVRPFGHPFTIEDMKLHKGQEGHDLCCPGLGHPALQKLSIEFRFPNEKRCPLPNENGLALWNCRPVVENEISHKLGLTWLGTSPEKK